MPKFRAAASRLTLAVALATGGAVAMTAVATPAMAQKKDAKAPKANYSKPFVAVYQPLAAAVTGAGDPAAVKPQLPALKAAASTPDDKYAAGQVVYTVGAKTNDVALQREGLDIMLDSGKMEGADYAKNLYAAASLAYNADDLAVAQKRAQQAIDAGYTGDAELLLAESYFGQDQTTQGLDYIDRAIAKKVAAGQPVPENWLKRALARSYEANLQPQSFKYAGMYAQYYPSATSWGDAIAIQRNLSEYGDQEMLDLMRLAVRTKSMRNERDYIDYINAADGRRLPGETQRIIDAGIAAGLLKQNDTLVNEARTIAAGRVKADMADLPLLQGNATKSGATATAAMAAGDAYLGYQQSAKAEEMYKLALSRPGVDTARVLTRLGIAQLDQGKYAEADANFLKVQGARQAIAQLWSIYGKQAAAPAAPAAQ